MATKISKEKEAKKLVQKAKKIMAEVEREKAEKELISITKKLKLTKDEIELAKSLLLKLREEKKLLV